MLLTVFASVALSAPAPLSYGVCVSCHGAHGEGRPELDSPRIAGLTEAYVASTLRGYRDGDDRSSELARIMSSSVVGISDDAIAELAAFVPHLDGAAQRRGPAVPGGSAAYSTCATCHGADADGIEAMDAPSLLHQDSAYLTTTMQDYRDGARGGPMAAFASDLSDDRIATIVGHIASLRPSEVEMHSPEVTLSRDEGLAAFADIYAAATHPRCMNCHPDGDVPMQGDDSHAHTMGITRQSPMLGVHCSTCHAQHPVGDGLAPLPPADPIWSLAPAEMVFQNRSPAELCAQLADPDTNGMRGFTDLAEHVRVDHLLITSWHSGRTPPPISHPDLVARFEAWGAAGGPCPEE